MFLHSSADGLINDYIDYKTFFDTPDMGGLILEFGNSKTIKHLCF